MDRLSKILGPRDPIARPPQEIVPVIVEPPRAALRPMIMLVTIVVLLLGVVNFLNRPKEIAMVPDPSVSSTSSPISLDVVVNVVGDVRSPGLVTLPVGSRVADAIAGAGGVTNSDSIGMLNLAARVVDGQQIIVLPEVNAMTVDSSSASAGKINLNSATVAQLDELPGVGPVMAGRIIAWRTQHSAFSTIEELQEVPGIGPKVFANLSELVTV